MCYVGVVPCSLETSCFRLTVETPATGMLAVSAKAVGSVMASSGLVPRVPRVSTAAGVVSDAPIRLMMTRDMSEDCGVPIDGCEAAFDVAWMVVWCVSAEGKEGVGFEWWDGFVILDIVWF